MQFCTVRTVGGRAQIGEIEEDEEEEGSRTKLKFKFLMHVNIHLSLSDFFGFVLSLARINAYTTLHMGTGISDAHDEQTSLRASFDDKHIAHS